MLHMKHTFLKRNVQHHFIASKNGIHGTPRQEAIRGPRLDTHESAVHQFNLYRFEENHRIF